jgi:hypothetical protein
MTGRQKRGEGDSLYTQTGGVIFIPNTVLYLYLSS